MRSINKMKKQSEQSAFSKLLHARYVVAVEIIVIVILAVAIGKEMLHKYQVQHEIDQLQAQADELHNSNTELQSLIAYFESDAYAEEQARLQLNMQKPGESVVTVLGADTDTPSGAGGDALAYGGGSQTGDQRTNPQRWWDHFFQSE